MLKKFSVSGKAGEVLNWSMGLFLAFSIISLIDHWTSAPNDGQTALTELFASVQKHSAIQIAESAVLLLTKLAMLEIFRRCLSRSNHFLLQLSVIVVMLLTTLMTFVSFIPSVSVTPYGVTGLQSGGEQAFLTGIYGSCSVVLFFVNLFLGIGLVRKFAGMIRWYGLSLFLCPVLISLLNMCYYYIYNYVGGVTMTAIITYGTIISLLSFALNLLPFCLLRGSMVTDD